MAPVVCGKNQSRTDRGRYGGKEGKEGGRSMPGEGRSSEKRGGGLCEDRTLALSESGTELMRAGENKEGPNDRSVRDV